jgi:hypothetical protein
MGQDEILKFMRIKRRPITKQDLNKLGFSMPAINRSIGQLKKYDIIDCKYNKRKPARFWLK